MGSGETARVSCVPAVPCWVSLMARDLEEAKGFYGPLLGWEFEAVPEHFGPYVHAVTGGEAVAGLGAAGGNWPMPVAWTSYFGTESADAAADAVRERGATLAVGPLASDAGRVAFAADPAGAVFGIWEGPLGRARRLDLMGAPVWIELRTPDPFAAALFYGEVFRWDGRDPERFEVHWEHDRVVLRAEGHSVAALAKEQAGGPAGTAPHWEVSFSVADTDRALVLAERLGGSALGPAFDSPYGRVARLQDPEGGRFAVISPKG
ncbi:VOC family protein [Streptomyces kaniharaensis]|uniref:VOC family protein n=1 Tax=Streptomyces kaniharaensis TaxID=212423 RepID=A0A6N7KJ71_9ACTN|nr:VOC family protein [Streptomyces kaniharaensis]MQS11562.1 VOC family protein [Streptomyces kaniharaensis]